MNDKPCDMWNEMVRADSMHEPICDLKSYVAVHKVYVWHTTEAQLDDAVQTFMHRCHSLAGNIHEGLVNSCMMYKMSQAETDIIQSTIDKLRCLPETFQKQVNATLKPLCNSIVDHKLAVQIDIPKELMSIPDMRNMLMDFERDAHLFGNLGDFSTEFWVKPDVIAEYRQELVIREV